MQVTFVDANGTVEGPLVSLQTVSVVAAPPDSDNLLAFTIEEPQPIEYIGDEPEESSLASEPALTTEDSDAVSDFINQSDSISQLDELIQDDVIFSPIDESSLEGFIDERSKNTINKSKEFGIHYKAVPDKFLDLNELQLSDFESSNPKTSHLRAITTNDSFVKELFKLSQDMDESFEQEQKRYQLGSEVAVGTAVSLTAGIVSWILRSGSLVASLLSIAPIWKQLDPLPILGGDSKKRKDRLRDEEDQQDEEDNNNAVENIFDDE